MDNLLKKQTISVSHYALDCQEECAISGDYTLPEYCPDVATVLKCLVTPRVQNRQWSGEQLLVDGVAAVRVLYLDEERRCLREAEFTQPFSCSMRTEGRVDAVPAALELSTKYVNCRAVGPRRLEVRGAIALSARAECAMDSELTLASEDPHLYTKCETAAFDTPVGSSEKVLAISESLDFPETLPPAEMLLGGDCRAAIRECRVLTGKAIVKGQVYFHQLYTDDLNAGTTHSLDFVVPFSQILDIDGAEDGQPHSAHVLLLSDTERCTVGPDGENSVLEVTAKLLVQFRAYRRCEVPLLLDAYHGRCPVTVDTRDVSLRAHMGCRWENTVLPMQLELPTGVLQEILDVWAQPQGLDNCCEKGTARISGRLLVCMLVRDGDGQIAYYERPEEYRLEYPCSGNDLQAHVTVTELHYRVVDNKLELKVTLCVALEMGQHTTRRMIQTVRLHQDAPYGEQRATTLLYYAQPGEELWEIGRKCHTSPDWIRQENDLSGDRLNQSSVLIVPIVS